MIKLNRELDYIRESIGPAFVFDLNEDWGNRFVWVDASIEFNEELVKKFSEHGRGIMVIRIEDMGRDVMSKHVYNKVSAILFPAGGKYAVLGIGFTARRKLWVAKERRLVEGVVLIS